MGPDTPHPQGCPRTFAPNADITRIEGASRDKNRFDGRLMRRLAHPRPLGVRGGLNGTLTCEGPFNGAVIPQGGIPHPRVQGGATPPRSLAPPREWPPLRVRGLFSRGNTQGQPRGGPSVHRHPGHLTNTQGCTLNMMVSLAPPPVANFGSKSPGNPFLLDKVSLV